MRAEVTRDTERYDVTLNYVTTHSEFLITGGYIKSLAPLYMEGDLRAFLHTV